MKPSGAAHDEEVLFQLLAEFDEALATNTSTQTYRFTLDAAKALIFDTQTAESGRMWTLRGPLLSANVGRR